MSSLLLRIRRTNILSVLSLYISEINYRILNWERTVPKVLLYPPPGGVLSSFYAFCSTFSTVLLHEQFTPQTLLYNLENIPPNKCTNLCDRIFHELSSCRREPRVSKF